MGWRERLARWWENEQGWWSMGPFWPRMRQLQQDLRPLAPGEAGQVQIAGRRAMGHQLPSITFALQDGEVYAYLRGESLAGIYHVDDKGAHRMVRVEDR